MDHDPGAAPKPSDPPQTDPRGSRNASPVNLPSASAYWETIQASDPASTGAMLERDASEGAML